VFSTNADSLARKSYRQIFSQTLQGIVGDGHKLAVPSLGEKGPHRRAAQLTVDLCDHPAAPNVLSDALIETLIDMAHEHHVNIWEIDGGLSADRRLRESVIDRPSLTLLQLAKAGK